MSDRTELRAQYSPYGGTFECFIVQQRAAGRFIAKPLEYEFHEDGDYVRASLRLDQDTAQRLIDDLWNGGLRPTQGKQSEGVTAAQANHLQDMRAIAFAKLRIDQP